MSDNKRIKKAINWLKSQGLISTQEEVGRKLGIENKSYLSQLVNSERPNEEFVNKFIVIAPMISRKWLLTGEGEMLTQASESTAKPIGRPFAASRPDEGVVNVRYFQVTPTATFQEFCRGESEIPESFPVIARSGEIINEDYCVFEISGDSMLPQIPHGSKVLCREIKASKWHQISSGVIVIAYADSFVIKRIVKNKLDSDDYLIITSDNPDYTGSITVRRCQIRAIFEAREVLSYPIR